MYKKNPNHIPDYPFLVKILLLAIIIACGTVLKGHVAKESKPEGSYVSKERTKKVKDQESRFTRLTHQIFLKSE